MGLLRFDSPLMRLLSKVADLLVVNLLVLICSLPIFTIGASFTAMQNILYRILHNEDVYVIREFFGSFKRNFKQATIIGLMLLPIILFLIYDYFMLGETDTTAGGFLMCVSGIMLILVFIFMMYVFPILSRYDNTTKETIKNAIVIAVSHPFRSILMVIIFAFCIFVEIIMPYKMFPILFCFCISVPWYFCSMVYMPIFDKLDGIDPRQIKHPDDEEE